MPQLKEKPRGSQKWIQNIINACPELLNIRIREKVATLFGREICWVSPLKEDEFAEYRDGAFLKRLNLQELSEELQQFWPKNGPQWDALGRTTNEKAFILVEAKANVPEMVSICGAKDEKSLNTISERLAETQRWLNCQRTLVDWKSGFYQYANRLAHLYFLREKAGKEAYLIFLYFIDDITYDGGQQVSIATSHEAWNSALKLQKKLMGLPARSLTGRVIELFISTNEINTIEQSDADLPPPT
ncbi:MAG: hypothetical protein FJ121_05055 [Deltaproteobacteria bacterium]|nr:hypothetical protein [Deltaproteobacteria bacterium]